MPRWLAGVGLAAGLLTQACNGAPEAPPGPRYRSPARLRVAAEWEPAVGALVAWPLAIPMEMAVEITRDATLVVMVENEAARAEATTALTAAGVASDRLLVVAAPGGAARRYPRDWGPLALFDPAERILLADPHLVRYSASSFECDGPLYDFGALREGGDTGPDDRATAVLARALKAPVLEVPLHLPGGNFLVDGHGTAFATCILLNEDRAAGIPAQTVRSVLLDQLGISDLVVLPNYERLGHQHVDCFLKLLDEETLLVRRVPPHHQEYAVTEELVRRLGELKTVWGRPYRILRLDVAPQIAADELQRMSQIIPSFSTRGTLAYVNALILNRKVFVPLYGVDGDEQALRVWRDAMPGYTVMGFPNPGPLGWGGNDAIHCRVRALWDPQMLYMSHRRVDATVEPADGYQVQVEIRDLSHAGLVSERLLLSWRLKGRTSWHEVPLQPTLDEVTFVATIPGADAGEVVEYFISATDRSGRQESLPRTAPQGFYSFRVVGQ